MNEQQSIQDVPSVSNSSADLYSKTYSKRKWQIMLGALLIAFAAYHIGWWRAMNYFGATWDTQKGGLHQSATPSQLPSHLLVCSSTLPKQCFDYRCPLGTSLVNPEQYSIPGGGSRQKECSDGSIATEVQMKTN